MTYSLQDLEVARRRVIKDRQMICAQQSLIDGMRARGEPSVPIPMKPPLCSEMIAPRDSGMISPP
ncbi:UNVERIFIED_ORG: hypothetical protein GGE64_006370 [Rhizobium etli]